MSDKGHCHVLPDIGSHTHCYHVIHAYIGKLWSITSWNVQLIASTKANIGFSKQTVPRKEEENKSFLRSVMRLWALFRLYATVKSEMLLRVARLYLWEMAITFYLHCHHNQFEDCTNTGWINSERAKGKSTHKEHSFHRFYKAKSIHINTDHLPIRQLNLITLVSFGFQPNVHNPPTCPIWNLVWI